MSHRFIVALLAVAAILPAVSLQAQDKIDHAKAPLPAGLVASDVKVAGTGVCFLEGPAVDDQGTLFFSDIAGNRILKMTADGKVSVFRADSGRTNGNAFDAQGRLISCEGGEQGPGRRRMVRTDMKTGKI
jgi:sugar lactone lactonase YvrE